MRNDIDIFNIKFRSKEPSWKQTRCVTLEYSLKSAGKKVGALIEPCKKSIFLKPFLRDLYIRPSCHKCPVRSFKSGSDITIADYWGIQNVLPEFDDDKGVSLVMVNTENGKRIYELLGSEKQETSYSQAFAGNPYIEKSVPLPAKRALFFKKYDNEPIIPLINRLTNNTPLRKMLIVSLRRLGLLSFVKYLLKK